MFTYKNINIVIIKKELKSDLIILRMTNRKSGRYEEIVKTM